VCRTAAGRPLAVAVLLVCTGALAGQHMPSRMEQSLRSTRRRLVLGRWSRVCEGIVVLGGRLLVLGRRSAWRLGWTV
jgi:hypothetical protein